MGSTIKEVFPTSGNSVFQKMNMTRQEIFAMHPLVLAYMGDAIFELMIRKYHVYSGNVRSARLHQMTILYVSAKAQAEFAHFLLEELSEEEKSVLIRGRNANSATIPKNVDVATYRWATGFEALLGFLYLSGNVTRMEVLVEKIIAYRQERLNEKK